MGSALWEQKKRPPTEMRSEKTQTYGTVHAFRSTVQNLPFFEDRAYLSHMGDFVEPPPKHRTRRKPRETTTQRPSPFPPFFPLLVFFGSSAMIWNHAVSWGGGVWVISVSDIGRVGHTGSGGWPTGIEKNQKTSVLLFGLGGGSTKSPMSRK